MNIKSTIKKLIPNKLLCDYNLLKLNIKGKKSYKKIEQEINKEYEKIFHRKLNWDNPQSWTEKVNVSKVYDVTTKKTDLTDKYKVRDFIKREIGEEYLIPLLGVYDKFEDIDFNKLPDKFVIKCNHDSGSTTLCEDKTKINYKELKNKYDFFLKRNYSSQGHEMQYKNIKPKIIIEKYMGSSINDYKFLCFNGKPYFVWVDVDRFDNHKRNVYDLDWNLQPFEITFKNSKKKKKKPKDFQLMKEVATKLCKEFDHVRVDLYYIDNKIYFGEMTFTSDNGFEIITPNKYDFELGKLWKNNIKKSDIKLEK